MKQKNKKNIKNNNNLTKKHITNKTTKNNTSINSSIMNLLSSYPEWKYFECIYFDKNIFDKINSYNELKDKIIVTKDSDNNFVMITYHEDYIESTLLDTMPTVDLMVLSYVDENFKEMIDIHTIFLKLFSDGSLYMADCFRKFQMINTNYEQIILNGYGVYTELLRYLNN